MNIGGSFWRGGGSERERFMVSGEVRVDAGEFACWRGGVCVLARWREL